jgi:hypothetical protein
LIDTTNVILNDKTNDIISDTFHEIITDNININDTLTDLLNDTSNEIQINVTFNDSLDNEINETLSDESDKEKIYTTINTTKINNYDIGYNFNHSSTILNNDNAITKKVVETTVIDKNPSEKIIPTTIIMKKEESQLNKTKDINNDKKKNNQPPDNSVNIQDKNELIEKGDDTSLLSGIFKIFKSFLKNKLIYFLLALLGVILCFIVVILISCAIISCIKMFQRRNYMQQVDIDVPKDSKYNTASISSKSS